ncbi:SDR family NAD(P)-dependent oxidoreductase [Actinomadura hibisca]|uniref:SDR family NAD(P)-dependent oxidoreductase n=1 Tax=Actinomadura hibisca TaxID=68565 RepID=UPI00082E5446|nr:SDR family NAD(P)-dependent oxidoreductase [Actinomadura hibisca]
MRYPAVARAGAVVAVTGGGRGIGRAAAEAFARRGATVCVGDRDAEAAAQTVADLGPGVHAFAVDVTDRDSYAAFLAGVAERAGPLDILVNNAGIMPLGPFLAEPDAVSAATLDVNVWGLVHGMRLALPGMIERGRGHVVNVASMAGKLPLPGMAVYNASKYAAVGLTAAVREEVAGTGVSVSAVLPTAVRTGLTEGVRLGGGLPTIDPERVAAAIVKSCVTRRAEYPVPGWLAAAQPVLGVTPEPVVRTVKRLLNGDRAYRQTFGARGDHDRRVIEQATLRAAPEPSLRPEGDPR